MTHDNVTDSKYHSGAIEVGQIYFDHHSDTNGTFECGKRIVQAADKAIRQAMEAQQADLATLGKQLENAREVIIEANNSLYGSQGYFLSLNGGPPNKYHLAEGIEELKSYVRLANREALKGQPC